MPDDVPTLTGLVADGRASALFAVLAGVGVALATGGPRRPPDARAHLARAPGCWCAARWSALLGLWLVGFDSPVAVILAYYGLLFVVAVPLLRLPAAVLGRRRGAGLRAGPGAQHAAARRPAAGARAGSPGWPRWPSPAELLGTLALTGYYPVLTWTTYLLAGMAVGRLDLRRVRVAVGLLVGGAALAVAAAGRLGLVARPGRRRRGARPGPGRTQLRHHPDRHLVVAGGRRPALGHAARPGPHHRHRAGRARRDAAAGPAGPGPLVWVPAAVGAIPLTLYTAARDPAQRVLRARARRQVLSGCGWPTWPARS